MVCIRCKMVVEEELKKLSLNYMELELGEVEIMENISAVQTKELRSSLQKYGLELLDDKKGILIEKIKKVIVELIHYADKPSKINFSNYLSGKLNHDYTYLANLFSEEVGINIEQYIIMHKIERVKELLIYDELSLTEISYKLHYSSVAHLSTQFKRITGLTPSCFKKFRENRRFGLVDPYTKVLNNHPLLYPSQELTPAIDVINTIRAPHHAVSIAVNNSGLPRLSPIIVGLRVTNDTELSSLNDKLKYFRQ